MMLFSTTPVTDHSMLTLPRGQAKTTKAALAHYGIYEKPVWYLTPFLEQLSPLIVIVKSTNF